MADTPKPQNSTSAARKPVVVTGKPEQRDSGGDPILDRLLGESKVLAAPKCSNCLAPMLKGGVICTSCGYNAQTGKAMRTAVLRSSSEEPRRGPKAAGGSRWASSLSTARYLPTLGIAAGVFVPIGIFTGLSEIGVVPGLIIFLIAGLVFLIGGIVIAFREDQTLWGWIGVLNFVPVVNMIAGVAFLVYLLALCPSNRIKAGYLGMIIGSLAFGVVGAISGSFDALASMMPA